MGDFAGPLLLRALARLRTLPPHCQETPTWGASVACYGPPQDATRDLANPANVEDLRRRIRQREFHWVHMGPPCTSFCRWFLLTCKSCSRTPENPAGLEENLKERIGNTLARICVSLARACQASGTSWTVENPRSSYLWRLPEYIALAREPGVEFVHVTMCAYGAPYLKRTSFLTNAPWVRGAASACSCTQRHERLQGSVRVGGRTVHRTALAAAYPRALCERLVALATDAADA